MGFCKHPAAKITAEFDEARAEKLKKLNFHNRFSSIFHDT